MSESTMKLAMCESPFNPTVEQIEERLPRVTSLSGQAFQWATARAELFRENIQYARLLCEHVRQLGYAPFASHLFYPQFLAEDSASRAAGIACRDAWSEKCSRLFFGVDLGWSTGMRAARDADGLLGRVRDVSLFEGASQDEVRAQLRRVQWREFVEL